MIRREPAAEAAAGRVEVPALDGPGDRAEDLLAEVVRIGVLEPLAPGQPVDQRLVERHELAPGPGVGRVAELDDQRVSRAVRAARPSDPPSLHPVTHSAGRGSFTTVTRSPATRYDRRTSPIPHPLDSSSWIPDRPRESGTFGPPFSHTTTDLRKNPKNSCPRPPRSCDTESRGFPDRCISRIAKLRHSASRAIVQKRGGLVPQKRGRTHAVRVTPTRRSPRSHRDRSNPSILPRVAEGRYPDPVEWREDHPVREFPAGRETRLRVARGGGEERFAGPPCKLRSACGRDRVTVHDSRVTAIESALTDGWRT